jgi:hypothetical protein
MNAQTTQTQSVEKQAANKADRPVYETPRIQAMSEKDILSTFQITQSMAGWWVNPSC